MRYRRENENANVDDHLAECTDAAERFYTRLRRSQLATDDFGNFRWSPEKLLRPVVPHVKSWTVAKITKILEELRQKTLLVKYHVAGKAYGHIMGFENSVGFSRGYRPRREYPTFPPDKPPPATPPDGSETQQDAARRSRTQQDAARRSRTQQDAAEHQQTLDTTDTDTDTTTEKGPCGAQGPSGTPKGVETSPKQPRASSPHLQTCKEFLTYFNEKADRKFTLTDIRRRLIEKRVKEGYTLEDLKKAVDNFMLDDWPDRAKYMDLPYIIGTIKGVDKLEKWLHEQSWEQRQEERQRKMREELQAEAPT